MKKLSNILSWAINILLFGGLVFFAVAFFLRGDMFHAIIDLLYLLIIVSNVVFRHLYNKMKRENESLLEGGKVLVEQNAKLTEQLADINDPFRDNRELKIRTASVRMETITGFIKYERDFVIECSNDERSRRYKDLEHTAKYNLLMDIIDTEIISTKHITDDEGKRRCIAEIIVGVKSDKPIDEIIKS